MNKNQTDIICKAISIAVGIATLVLAITKSIECNEAIILLSVGLTCIGIYQFNN